MAKETKKIEVLLQPINIKIIKVKIKGNKEKGLLMDKFPEDAKQQILAKQAGIAKGNKKKVRDINQEVKDAIHTTTKGIIGYPAEGFKKGMMECTSFVGDKSFSKKLVSGAVKIINGDDGIIPIKYKKQTILKHNIQHNIKFSPEFVEWSCELMIQYDANNISAQDIITLLSYAGFYIGVGAWRPKGGGGGSGPYGMYEVEVGDKS